MWWMECLCRVSYHLHNRYDPGAVWTCPKDSQSNLVHQLCMTLLSLAIPPFGLWANDKKNPNFVYEYKKQNVSSPLVFAHFLGYCSFCSFWGYWLILASKMSENQNHVVFISHYHMVQFDHSSMSSGSFTCTNLKCLECQRTLESCLECQCVRIWVEWDEKQVWYVTSSQKAVAAVLRLYQRMIKVPLTIFAHFTFGLQTKEKFYVWL